MKVGMGLVNVLTVADSVDLQANPLAVGMFNPVCGEQLN